MDVIPTWGKPDPESRRLVDALGCTTHVIDVKDLPDVPGLRGGIAVSMCNSGLLNTALRFKELGVRIVWLNCMTFISPIEQLAINRDGPFAAYVFQSHYQRSQLEPWYATKNVRGESMRVIREAFDAMGWDYSPRPHSPCEPFVVGRISRAAPDKFARDTWSIYERINYRPLRAEVLGWSDEVEAKVGKPPAWAAVRAQGAHPVRSMLRRLHAVVHVTGGSRENWPRVGLEAAAAGVPCVVERAFGWPEMIRHGVTGFLGDDEYEIAHWAGVLARDESRRLEIAAAARVALMRDLAEPSGLTAQWFELFSWVDTYGRA